MDKIKEKRIEKYLDSVSNTLYEAESYLLISGARVMWDEKSHSWRDEAGKEYTAVKIAGELSGFNKKDSLDEVNKKLLRQSPEGWAYLEYNERIGGERIAPVVPYGYEPEIIEYLEAGGTLENLYRECIQKGISWEERLGINTGYNPDVII